MEHIIYDAEKHIDIEYIESILKQNKNKKIICFGGGTAADILMKKLLHNYDVYAFVDNNKELWGKKIFEITICAPSILTDLEPESYIVLLLSKHVDAISRQLEEMGLQRDQDYYDIYNQFLAYFRIKKFETYAREFETFLMNIQDNTFDSIPIRNKKKIGVVCIAEMIKTVTWYPMAQCILLRYRGYTPVLIMDHLKSFDDYIYFDGISDIAQVYTEYMIRLLRRKCPDIEVMYIEEQDKAELEDADIQMAKTYAPVVLKWLDSRRDEVFLSGNAERIRIAEEILQSTMQSIQYFLRNNRFDSINVYTGIHRHRCVYNYIGHKYGMRVSTYDGDISRATLNETDGVSGHAGDIPKMIEGDYFSEAEQQKILELARSNFEKRRSSIAADGGYCFQKVKESKIGTGFDVIMPLNIAWDSAALGLDDVFESDTDWLQQTLQFMMEHTDVTVMVREHPAQRMTKEFLYADFEKKLPILSAYPERIRFMKADADINTYQYIAACKLILPYSSTIGLEAAMMYKPVIVHTRVYYADYVEKAVDKEDYFRRIKQVLEHGETIETCDERIYQAYIYQMHHGIKTDFNECFYEWMNQSLEELNKMQGVDEIIHILAEDMPGIYYNIKRVIAG